MPGYCSRDSITEKRKKCPQLVDMTAVRRARIKHVSLLSLPGYYNPFYLQAKEQGCSYESGDLEDVASLVDPKATNILLSPTPPEGQGPDAVDMGRGNTNMGDSELKKMLKKSGIQFGIFGHVYESGGNATSSDGKTKTAEGVWHNSVFLQAGASDSVPVSLVNGGRAAGMAHIIEFSGKRGRFRPIMAGQKLQ